MDTIKDFEKLIQSQPLQFMKKNSLAQLAERWIHLLRLHGSTMAKYEGGDRVISPTLFDIANEMDAFFVGLNCKI